MRYAIHFSDGFKTDCLTSEGALRVIAYRSRATRTDLVTDTTEGKILVWLHSSENAIAEVITSI